MPAQLASLFTRLQWTRLETDLDLSPRELQVLQGACGDLKELAIAQALGISTHTVRSHFERLYRKLGVTSRSGLLVRVFRQHLIKQ